MTRIQERAVKGCVEMLRQVGGETYGSLTPEGL